ncbi:MAG: hypothetical protein K0S12_1789, partial [Bacteroidetes bacterium]|nr:hypothetical protein [Bacteroidota bacterium]
ELNVYTAIIEESALSKQEGEKPADEISIEKMIPFSDEMKVNFNTKEKMEISAELTRPLDPEFQKILFKDKKFKTGNNTLSIKMKDLALQKGSYVLTLYFRNKTTFVWITGE